MTALDSDEGQVGSHSALYWLAWKEPFQKMAMKIGKNEENPNTHKAGKNTSIGKASENSMMKKNLTCLKNQEIILLIQEEETSVSCGHIYVKFS